MIFILLLSCLVSYTLSFTIKYRHSVPFICEIHDLNINKIDSFTISELQYLFRATPVLVFKNQKITAEQQFKFCGLFDLKHTLDSIHPFKSTEVPDCPQIALRGKGYINDTFGVKNEEIQIAKTFKYNKVWHQDMVGVKNRLPTVVSSMYMLRAPEVGGSTLFASMEKGYENMMSDSKNILKYKSLQACYSTLNALFAEIDHTGYSRIDKYWNYNIDEVKKLKDDFVIQPLIVYPTESSIKKSLMLSPNKLYSFIGLTPQKSQEMMHEIMNKYVLLESNIGEVKYNENDLVIFNNRKVIHTSTPTEAIIGDRLFSLLFLDSKEKYKNGFL
jgi:alpha-ketoglutarate-dependent taurine dioxygenase